jgi:hypothetical protein
MSVSVSFGSIEPNAPKPFLDHYFRRWSFADLDAGSALRCLPPVNQNSFIEDS